jgi:hypothetical protein
MDTSGKPHEGWMTVVPVTVFLLIIVTALGGPTAFVNTVSLWLTDFLTGVAAWVRQF